MGDWTGLTPNQIINKLKGHRTALNHTSKTLKALIDRYGKTPSSSTKSLVDREMTTFLDRIELMESAYEHLKDGATGDDVKLYDDKLTSIINEKDSVRNIVLDALDKKVAPGTPGGAATFKKINDALKPHTLTQEMTPEELRAWTRMFKSFYTTGNLVELRIID